MKKLTKTQKEIIKKMKEENKVIYYDNETHKFYLSKFKTNGSYYLYMHEYARLKDLIRKNTVEILIKEGYIIEKEYDINSTHFVLNVN